MDSVLEKLFEGLISGGPIAVVLGIMIAHNWRLVERLFQVIEQNTKALSMTAEKLDELTEAQRRRRQEYGGN